MHLASNTKLISEILQVLRIQAPEAWAAKWDPVGLLCGDEKVPCTGIALSAEIDLRMIKKAEQLGCNLIITHHPALFPKSRPFNRLIPGDLVYEAIQRKIALYSIHSNFDQAATELGEHLARELDFKIIGRLHEVVDVNESIEKLVTYVPEESMESVADALFEAGAGQIGDYDRCSFRIEGQGTFRPGPGTTPSVGEVGIFEKIKEVRLEVILPSVIRKTVIAALKEAHPYEEPAYECLSLKAAPPLQGFHRGLGYGVVGEFHSARTLEQLSDDLKRVFDVPRLFLTTQNELSRSIRKIAFAQGKVGSFLQSARQHKVDAFVGGEVGYHLAKDFAQNGGSTFELGHLESERFFSSVVEGWLKPLQTPVTRMDVYYQKII